MLETSFPYVHLTAQAVDLTGVAIISVGALASSVTFVLRLAAGEAFEKSVAVLRSSLGVAILAGLDFLIAAQVIIAITLRPTLQSVLVLAGIVLIRTFLSLSLKTEIHGQWPWKLGGRARGT